MTVAESPLASLTVAPGATLVVEVPADCGPGDYCEGVGFSEGWRGLSAIGCVKAAGVVTLALSNPAGSDPISLPAGVVTVSTRPPAGG